MSTTGRRARFRFPALSRAAGARTILLGVACLALCVAAMWLLLRSASGIPGSALVLLLLIPMWPAVALIFLGASAFYTPRWMRRIVAPRLRRERNRMRRRHGRPLMRELESVDRLARLRAHARLFRSSFLRSVREPSSAEHARLMRLAVIELRTLLIVVVAPIFLFAAAGLALPPYSGPQPPGTVFQWAHQMATRISGVVFSGAGIHILLLIAGVLPLYLWNQRVLRRPPPAPGAFDMDRD